MPKDLTTSVYTFSDLRSGNFLYVDKTEYLWKLISPAKAMYFLSRPRRFGKSLTISTLDAIFKGRKELFEGLAIHDRQYDWKPYPVIRISMSGWELYTLEKYTKSLIGIMHEQARANGVAIQDDAPATMFRNLIDALKEKGQVVVLIDEYDKPMMDNITSPDIQGYLKLLKSFYSVLKDREADIRFAFITGVTKICHVSLFSDLNNLTDISMDADYATMLGYTQEEFEANFAEWLAETEPKLPFPHDQLMAELKNWYDGFKFHQNAQPVYNPVSLANFFLKRGEFRNYWFTTGTPTALLHLMKTQSLNLPEALETPVQQNFFEAFEVDRIDAKTLMYQTGYLTLSPRQSQYQSRFSAVPLSNYYLDFPNYEVRSSFNEHLLNYYADVPLGSSYTVLHDLTLALEAGDIADFIAQLKTLFARIPYELRGRNEADYQTILYVIFMMLFAFVDGEHHTHRGRIDVLLSTDTWTYILELKINRPAEEALEQIRDRDYAAKFLNRGKRVMAVGISFDTDQRQIADWRHEEIC